MEALVVLSPFVGAAVFVGIALWLERATSRPGLFFLLIGVAGLIGVGVAIAWGGTSQRVLSLLVGMQAIGFLYAARWRHTTARSDGDGSTDD